MASEAWSLPPVFGWLQAAGSIDTTELLKTFNCGIGLVLVVSAESEEAVRRSLAEAGEATVHRLGEVVSCGADEERLTWAGFVPWRPTP